VQEHLGDAMQSPYDGPNPAAPPGTDPGPSRSPVQRDRLDLQREAAGLRSP